MANSATISASPAKSQIVTPLATAPRTAVAGVSGYAVTIVIGVGSVANAGTLKSVQSLADGSAAVAFGAIEEALGHSMMEPEKGESNLDLDEDDDEFEGASEEGIDFRFVESEDDILDTYRGQPVPARPAEKDPLDRERLQGVLKELIDCRQLLDRAMKDG